VEEARSANAKKVTSDGMSVSSAVRSQNSKSSESEEAAKIIMIVPSP
jgi:hypothetical protein